MSSGLIDSIAARYGLDAEQLPVRHLYWHEDLGQFYSLGPATLRVRGGRFEVRSAYCDHCYETDQPMRDWRPAPTTIASLADWAAACNGCRAAVPSRRDALLRAVVTAGVSCGACWWDLPDALRTSVAFPSPAVPCEHHAAREGALVARGLERAAS